MIIVEGYRAFRGTAKIFPRANCHAPFTLNGDFLYKPDTGCWYHDGHSYSEGIFVAIHDETRGPDDE